MAKRNIVVFEKDEDQILRKRSREVMAFDKKLHDLLDDMKETMYANDGVGLAAVQVGILKRVVVIDCGDHLYELVNPEIIESDGEQTGAEGCLSFPDEYGEVTRPNHVKVHAFDRDGNAFEAEGTELLARAFCHEIDHLNGVLFPDHATEMYETEESLKNKRKRRR